MIKNEKDQFNLPHEGKTTIPVTIIDGYGEVTISSQPARATRLLIENANCNKIYTVTFSYVQVNGGAEYISEDQCLLKMENNAVNQKIIENAKTIEIESEEILIDFVEVVDDSIYLHLQASADYFNEMLGNSTYVNIQQSN